MNPKITIVTPNYNCSQFLEQTIKSILEQSYPNLEYIIIDGGSTDNSVNIIKDYERHLAYWEPQENQGQYKAINKGFTHSTGDIMAWLNSDDMYFPWTLKTVASIMSAHPEIEWLTALQRGVWDWHSFCIGFFPIAGYSRDAFLEGRYLPYSQFGGCIQQESTFWRRSLWEKAGGKIPEEFELAGDFDLWTRFYQHAELYSTTAPLGGFRYRKGQGSSRIDRYLSEAKQALENMRTALKWSPQSSQNTANRLKLHRIPIIRRFFGVTPRYYSGKRVVRQQPETSEGYWAVEEYTFL